MDTRDTRAALIACILALGAPSAMAAENPLSVTPITDQIHMIEGAGGNAAIVVGEEAVFLIDDKVNQVSAPLLDLANGMAMEHTGRPVDFVLNTHLHGDHTGSNLEFREAGSWVVAHENVRARMSDQDEPAGALPVLTFSEDMSFHLNGLELRAMHRAHAHTDGDSVVMFSDVDVVHMGDIFFNQRYPYIDVDNGGDVDGVIAAVEDMLTRIGPETRIIPGHGPLASIDDLIAYRDLLVTVRDRVAEHMHDGESLEDILAAGVTAEYDEVWTWNFIDSPKLVTSIYRSLEGDPEMHSH